VQSQLKSTTIIGVPAMTDREFGYFQSLIYRETGIYLSPLKRTLLVGRLTKRLRNLGLQRFGDYYDVVIRDAAEKVQMINCICTNETHFFREKRHFEFLQTNVFPNWRAQADEGRRPHRVRVWSAGCSTGEEPYSFAMFLLDHFAPAWSIEILATDISTRALEKAEAGIWPASKLTELPERCIKRFMLKGSGKYADMVKIAPEVRALVSFQRLSLVTDNYPSGSFDLILCCNVLIYFNTESKRRVLDRLVQHLQPTGYLICGRAESLNGITGLVRPVAPTIYASERNDIRKPIIQVGRTFGVGAGASFLQYADTGR